VEEQYNQMHQQFQKSTR